ncbi:TPA: UvrD-helicase domain-containing protein [Elizabethkingia meningoseptica]
MPQEMFNVSLEDIRYAESVLLPEGKTFDEERISFIRNFDTIDLQAVPGSGKTTVLLAKLLILETKLPLKNNRGVLILSHTNTAIDEIRDKIGKYCPSLFSYPNFIGTIQAFVDQFLAIPFYNQSYRKKIIRIDNEIYREKVKKCLSNLWLYKLGFTDDIIMKISYIRNVNESLFYDFRFDYTDRAILINKFNGNLLEINKPRGNTLPRNYEDYTPDEKAAIYNWFHKFKHHLLKEGILHFDDAYFLANVYLAKKPKVKEIIQQRFKYIFIDEMQDVDKHQYDLLETVFYDSNNSTSNYQRIGDKNQAIYTGDVSLNNIWCFRDSGRTKNINGSQRLSENIAKLVNCFALSREGNFEVVGKNENCNLKPHLIVFKIENIRMVIPRFSELIDTYLKSGEIVPNPKNKYKAIGWIKEKPDDTNKLAIKSYFENLVVENTVQKIDYENLDSYLILGNKDKGTLKTIRKNIINALIKALRLEGEYYSENQILNYMELNCNEEYISLKTNLYSWSIDIVRGKFSGVYDTIKTYIPSFLELFGKTVKHSNGFINDTSVNVNNKQGNDNYTSHNVNNKLNIHGFDIDIATVHSVKGETHAATLYLETFYQNGHSNYETQRLSDQFKFLNFNKIGVHNKQSTKMAYVGFSRPTSLLCIAVCKERFDVHLNDIDRERWTIIEI